MQTYIHATHTHTLNTHTHTYTYTRTDTHTHTHTRTHRTRLRIDINKKALHSDGARKLVYLTQMALIQISSKDLIAKNLFRSLKTYISGSTTMVSRSVGGDQEKFPEIPNVFLWCK
ncbi:hypothetical protein LOAG_05872 [Loa loa]|uniref:Uncharacterized protein n=1 Tax=Loa loa TaxID=7209 RepID=A0A1S0TZB6_LOALO|nr:hypothetical protein LOAG_05872 [Loa loa]EFO22614.1 hypothetical protein LOAG_05872 [Loa loa]